MKYHEISTNTNKKAKRVGRGIAAGQGKTAGRGTKGQMSRAGSSKKPGFEGGQNPLMQRLPKLRGFKGFKARPEAVYTGQLDALASKTIDATALAEAGLISSPFINVKVISKGELTKKVTVKLPAASESAKAAIQKAGGSFEQTPRLARPKTSTKEEK